MQTLGSNRVGTIVAAIGGRESKASAVFPKASAVFPKASAVLLAIFAIALSIPTSAKGQSQSWASKMFATLDHDFGTVARGSKSEFAFELQNVYQEDVHIAAVRSSCGCTEPVVSHETLKSWEKGTILAKYNTVGFKGTKGATITVVIDKPYYQEVQLQVHGYIRSDVVFDPAEVNFGEGAEGADRELTVSIHYAGRSNWKIEDVRSPCEHLQGRLEEVSRGNGEVRYNLTLKLLGTLPAGDLNQVVTLVTNDNNKSTVMLPVRGRVLSDLTLSPANLALGDLSVGDKITKRLVVKAAEAFAVTEVRCKDPRFSFAIPEGSKKLQFIELTFDPSADAEDASAEDASAEDASAEDASAENATAQNAVADKAEEAAAGKSSVVEGSAPAAGEQAAAAAAVAGKVLEEIEVVTDLKGGRSAKLLISGNVKRDGT
jgi:hypothetical protein